MINIRRKINQFTKKNVLNCPKLSNFQIKSVHLLIKIKLFLLQTTDFILKIILNKTKNCYTCVKL